MPIEMEDLMEMKFLSLIKEKIITKQAEQLQPKIQQQVKQQL